MMEPNREKPKETLPEDEGGSSLDELTAEERAERRQKNQIANDEQSGGTIPSDNPPEEE